MKIGPHILYRLSQRLSAAKLERVAKFLDLLNRLFFSCWIPHGSQIGKNPVFGYGGLGIVIHAECKIGDRVHIDQHVTIGGNAVEKGVPQIGNDVYIGSGAKLLGPITIGDNVKIGANAVVLQNLPDGCTAVGVPARIVKHKQNC